MANKVELQERNGPWAHVSFVLGSHAPEASRPKQIKNMVLLSPSCMKKPKLLFLFVVAKDPFFAMLSSIPKSFFKMPNMNKKSESNIHFQSSWFSTLIELHGKLTMRLAVKKKLIREFMNASWHLTVRRTFPN